MNSAVDLFATYAGRGSGLTEWLNGAAVNSDRNLRMQYLAGFGMDLDASAAIYADMLATGAFQRISSPEPGREWTPCGKPFSPASGETRYRIFSRR